MESDPDPAAPLPDPGDGMIPGASGIGRLLRGAFDAWAAIPRRRHLAVLLLLIAVLAVRYRVAVFSPLPIEDEGVYFDAFATAASGRSPYTGAYYYPPSFALLGAWGVEHFGTATVLTVLRLSNLTGMALCAWISAAWLPWPWTRRAIAAVVYVTLAPAVALGIMWGNLSFVVIGMLLLGLLLWYRRPILAAILLGLSLTIKPVGPVTIGALFIHRPATATRRHMVVAAAALALAMALLLPLPWLADLFAIGGQPGNARNMALHHLLHTFGVRVSTLTIVIAVAAATAMAGRLICWTRESLLALACVAGVLSLPMVWANTLLLVLPLQVMALVAALARRRALPPDANLLRRYEATFVMLAVFAMQFCEGLGGIETWPVIYHGLAALLPIFSAPALLLYLLCVSDIGRLPAMDSRRAAVPS